MPDKRMNESKRRELRRLYFDGLPVKLVAEAVGCHISLVAKSIRRLPWPPYERSALRLSLEEREEISRGLNAKKTFQEIARGLGRQTSTVSREVNAQGPRERYRAWRGEQSAERTCRRQRPGKLEASARLRSAVDSALKERWSPEQVSQGLKTLYPDDRTMRVSHETIYKALYIQARGSLKKVLIKHLRTGRTRRRSRAREEQRRHQTNMVMISQRPAEADDRAVPGHWEGDLIMGQGNLSAIGTLVERSTRFVMLLHLPNGKLATDVREALTAKIQTLPVQLRRSITWDQGAEMSQHAQFTIDTGVAVYFCDPHSPWQRGSNENTNGLLRQYFPKGEDLSRFTAKDLDDAARQLNDRPRETLGWSTPAKTLTACLR